MRADAQAVMVFWFQTLEPVLSTPEEVAFLQQPGSSFNPMG
ncbi:MULTISPECIES: hypothetical protein [Bacteria]|nr:MULTISPECIES: hypothetical protein [Bacteria]